MPLCCPHKITTRAAVQPRTCVRLDGRAHSSADPLPVPLPQHGVAQRGNEGQVRLEGLQLLPRSLGSLQGRPRQLPQQLAAATPPPVHEACTHVQRGHRSWSIHAVTCEHTHPQSRTTAQLTCPRLPRPPLRQCQ
jgi:hypothetical protein